MSEKSLLCVALVLESGQRCEAKIYEDGTYRIENGPYKKMPVSEFEMARILERRSQRTHWLMANAYEIEDIKVGSDPPADYVEDLGDFTEADFLIPETPIVPQESASIEGAEKEEAPNKRKKKFLFFGGKKGKPDPKPAPAEKVLDTADESPTAKWLTEETPAPATDADSPSNAPAEPMSNPGMQEKPEDAITAHSETTQPEEQPEQAPHSKKKKGKGKNKKQAEAPKDNESTAREEETSAPAKEPAKKKPSWFAGVLIACILLAVLGWFGGNAWRERMGAGPQVPVSTPEPSPEPAATPAPPARPQIYLTIDATEGAEVSGSANVNVSGVDTEEQDRDGEDGASSPVSSAAPDSEEGINDAG